MKPCDICLEKTCKATNGVGTCNCKKCKVSNICNRKLRATIRITLKCTQTCSHCCFSCSPTKDTHMSIDTARIIAEFLISNEVHSVNLMGGEIFCNPDWKAILDLLIPAVKYARIVTNGDWSTEMPEFAEYLAKYDNLAVSISKDKWHTNKNIELANDLLVKNNVITKTSDLKETDDGLVPIGRSMYGFGIYSMFGCYCHNPEHEYSFLIDENGKIYKCGFGVWDYANVHEYSSGGFPARFKEFNKVFYSTFIPSCSRCINAYNLK